MKLHHMLFAVAGLTLTTAAITPVSASQEKHDHTHQAEEPQELSAEGLALLQPQETDAVLGEESAPILVVEYASLSCPHCASFHKDVYPHLKEHWIDSGKARFIYRNYPLNGPAFFASKLTRCGGPEKFHDLVKVLMANQTSWALAGKDTVEKLQKYASLAGIDKESFNGCMADKKMEEQILSHMKDAKEKLKLRSTPTLFINGKELRGAPSIEMLDKMLQDALAEAKPVETSPAETTTSEETPAEVEVEENTKAVADEIVDAAEEEAVETETDTEATEEATPSE